MLNTMFGNGAIGDGGGCCAAADGGAHSGGRDDAKIDLASSVMVRRT